MVMWGENTIIRAQVTSTSCTKDCDDYRKYDSTKSSSYVEDGTVVSLEYEDGSKAKGKVQQPHG